MSIPAPASSAADVPSTYDVIVVGLGALGAATAWHLRSAGLRVLGIERFALGHDRGASHDAARVLRHSYHRADYVRLTKQAYADWAHLEEASGQRLVTTTGGIDLCPADSALSLASYSTSLAEGAIPFEILDAKEIRARWPQMRVGESTAGLYQGNTGILAASRTVATLHSLAARAGAVLVDREPVTGLRELAGSVTVTTARRTFSAQAAVLCADAWLPALAAPLGWAPQLTVLDQQVTYYEPGEPAAFAPDRFPIWNWVDDPCFYGFPCYGEPTVKAAEDGGGQAADPDQRVPGIDREALERLSRFMSRAFPASGRPVRSVRCLYTMTRDHDLVLGTVPGTQRVHVALGAAHGFKFAPTIGRLMTSIVTGSCDRGAEWVRAFAPGRPALNDPDYAATWVV
jgi:monomeric sarcosine oxidase